MKGGGEVESGKGKEGKKGCIDMRMMVTKSSGKGEVGFLSSTEHKKGRIEPFLGMHCGICILFTLVFVTGID